MLRLKFISAGMSSTIQDQGRNGYRYYGVPGSGYMDTLSAALANLLVGNPQGSALIEFTYQGGALSFDQTCQIALTGADLNWTINGKKIALNTRIEIKAGQILKGGFSTKGMRGYLAVAGKLTNGINSLGSQSTYSYAKLGGLAGTILKKDNILTYETSDLSRTEITIDLKQIELDSKTIPLKRGPEFSILAPNDQKQIFDQTYKLGSESNRMGARLIHEAFESKHESLNRSKPCCPGIIQLLPAGQLVVLLNDGQTTGGYPRVGYIPPKALNQFNQIRLGNSFKFTEIR